MKIIIFCLLLALHVAVSWAQSEPADPPANEPSFYDYYLNLQQMQERLAARSLDEQARLEPRMRRAELEACRQLRKEREERVNQEDYRRQGGNQFVAFAQDFERYCERLR